MDLISVLLFATVYIMAPAWVLFFVGVFLLRKWLQSKGQLPYRFWHRSVLVFFLFTTIYLVVRLLTYPRLGLEGIVLIWTVVPFVLGFFIMVIWELLYLMHQLYLKHKSAPRK